MFDFIDDCHIHANGWPALIIILFAIVGVSLSAGAIVGAFF